MPLSISKKQTNLTAFHIEETNFFFPSILRSVLTNPP